MARRDERIDRAVATVGDRDLDDFGVRKDLAHAARDRRGSFGGGQRPLESIRRNHHFVHGARTLPG